MKKKRIISSILALALAVFMLAACGGGGGGSTTAAPAAGEDTTAAAAAADETTAAAAEETTAGAAEETTAGEAGETEVPAGSAEGEGISGANIAFICPADDALGINDKGWIQKTYEGVKNYGDANGKTYTWYRPTDNSTQGYMNSIATAINSGTEVIVTLGFQPVEALAQAQYDYPDTKFISVEGNGVESDIADNHFAIFHQVDEAGFLAGYTAVRSGYKDIGILNGLDIPPMNIWVWGYVQGMNYAAGKLGIDGVTVRHTYSGFSTADPSIQTLASSWYADGREIILPMMAGGNNSLFAAATAAQKPCYGADVDQSAESEMIQTCPVKNLDITVGAAVASVYDGTFEGGKYVWYNVDDVFEGKEAVGLATDNWKVPNFTVEEYQEFLQEFKNDVDGMRSGIITQDTAPSIDELWEQIPEKHIEFINIQ